MYSSAAYSVESKENSLKSLQTLFLEITQYCLGLANLKNNYV